MKAFRILFRNIRDSFKSVFRNFSLSLASISCITVTLVVVAIAVILSQNVNNFASLVEKDLTIVAFLDLDITEEQIKEVEEKINDIADVESFTFQSKSEIAKEMMESSEIFKNIMSNDDVTNGSIQDTFQVKASDIEVIKDVANDIKNIEHVKSVSYGEGMIEQLITVFDVVRKISIGVVIALIVVTAFLIANTIKITIFSRKREIEIMRLVGASNINIKIPFILEGLLLGLLGAIIPVVLTVIGYNAIYDHFNGVMFSQFIKLIKPEPFVYYISLTLIGIGMVVGMIGSARAVRKYLKI